MKFIIPALLILHGLIHLMGFTKAFGYAEMVQLSSPISKCAGSVWLITALVFVIAAILCFTKIEYWWLLALPAVITSQVVTFMSWPEQSLERL